MLWRCSHTIWPLDNYTHPFSISSNFKSLVFTCCWIYPTIWQVPPLWENQCYSLHWAVLLKFWLICIREMDTLIRELAIYLLTVSQAKIYLINMAGCDLNPHFARFSVFSGRLTEPRMLVPAIQSGPSEILITQWNLIILQLFWLTPFTHHIFEHWWKMSLKPLEQCPVFIVSPHSPANEVKAKVKLIPSAENAY